MHGVQDQNHFRGDGFTCDKDFVCKSFAITAGVSGDRRLVANRFENILERGQALRAEGGSPVPDDSFFKRRGHRHYALLLPRSIRRAEIYKSNFTKFNHVASADPGWAR